MNGIRVFALASMFIGAFATTQVHSQVYLHGQALSLALANKAASAAVEQCAKKGFPVSVAVVDPSGEMRVFLKSDQATIHTKDASFRKAYTIVTFGPVFNLDLSSAVATKIRSNVNGAAFAGIPDILLLPGGVIVRDSQEVIGAIGVSGSPDGMVDEACALAGVDAIRSRM